MTALVTGAGGAIGSAIVRGLLARGTDVIAQDIAPVEHAGARPLAFDLCSSDAAAAIRGALDGAPLEAVIAAHGIDGSGSLERLEPGFVRRVMDVNAATVPRLLEATAAALTGGGRFVAIASQAGLQGERDNAAYCASKFAVVGWVRAIAPALAARGVRVHALCPGCTESPLLFAAQERFAAASGIDPAAFTAQREARIPVGRFARVEETAAAALYLAEPDGERPTVLACTGGEVTY